MAFEQPKLPYALDALAPFLSREQMMYHYEKHQAAYFKKLNALVENKPEANLPLREVIVKAAAGAALQQRRPGVESHVLLELHVARRRRTAHRRVAPAIEASFGGFDAFEKEFGEKAVGLFGSGWTWLAADPAGKLEIMPLGNADTPLKHAREPVLTVDVWEHAYYIDYRNERPRFVDGFWAKVNWEFAAKVVCRTAAKIAVYGGLSRFWRCATGGSSDARAPPESSQGLCYGWGALSLTHPTYPRPTSCGAEIPSSPPSLSHIDAHAIIVPNETRRRSRSRVRRGRGLGGTGFASARRKHWRDASATRTLITI